jgi:type IV secretory pathway VirB10-like protein
MDSHLLGRRIAAISGVTAFIAMGALTAACAKEQQKAPETTTTTTTTATTTSAPAPEPAPTEKSINPTGGNLFTPPVLAPPAPTVPPGQHPGINGIP